MKIAIPTQDKQNIFKRTGRAPLFVIYEYKNGVWNETGSVTNRHHHEEHHHEGEAHSHAELVKQIESCDAILLNHVGKHLKNDLEQAGIKIIKTEKENIKEALEFVIKKG